MAKEFTPGVKTSRGGFRNKNLLSHYHDITQRVFTDGRGSQEQLNELFLNAVRSGDYDRTQNFLARASKHAAINVDFKEKKGGKTALMFAVENNNEKLVSLLLNYGADVTLCNNNRNSVLDYAPNNLKALLLGSVERQGSSSKHLLQAAWQGDIESVKKVLASRTGRVDVNCRNADGMTPLLLVTRDVDTFEKVENAVIRKGYDPVAVVMELLNHKADCHLSDTEGRGPLHMAAHCKGSKAKNVVDVLLQKGLCDIDAQDSSRNCPIHWASKHDNCQVLLALIQNGADPNARGNIGRTPLHVAASCGHEQASFTLLSHGADVTLVDDHGCSPVDVAQPGRVQSFLKEAWAEQTNRKTQSIKRICSAPVLEHTVHLHRRSLSPEYLPSVELTSPNNLVKQPSLKNNGDSVTQQQRKPETSQLRLTSGKTRPEKKLSVKPSSPQNGVTRPSFSAGQISSQQIPIEFPKLSVLNMEFKYVRNLRAGPNRSFRAISTSSQTSFPQRRRVYQRFSNPLPRTPHSPSSPTASKEEKRSRSQSTGKLPNRSQLEKSRKTSIPSRVPPLPLLSPENRPMATPEVVLNGANKVDVLDLDILKLNGSLQSSTCKVLFGKDKEVLSPPPSLSNSPIQPLEGNKPQFELENKPDDVERASPSDDFNKTLTLSPTSASKFWIPYNSETSEDYQNNRSSFPDTVKTTSLSRQSSTTFFIDLNEESTESPKKEVCFTCGKVLEKEKEGKKHASCKECASRRLSSAGDSFWVSLESHTINDKYGENDRPKEIQGSDASPKNETFEDEVFSTMLDESKEQAIINVDKKDDLSKLNSSKVAVLIPKRDTSTCASNENTVCSCSNSSAKPILATRGDESACQVHHDTVEPTDEGVSDLSNKTWSKDERTNDLAITIKSQNSHLTSQVPSERNAATKNTDVEATVNGTSDNLNNERSAWVLSSFDGSEEKNTSSLEHNKEVEGNNFDTKDDSCIHNSAKIETKSVSLKDNRHFDETSEASIKQGSQLPGNEELPKERKEDFKTATLETSRNQGDDSAEARLAWESPRRKKHLSPGFVSTDVLPSPEPSQMAQCQLALLNEYNPSDVVISNAFPSPEPFMTGNVHPAVHSSIAVDSSVKPSTATKSKPKVKKMKSAKGSQGNKMPNKPKKQRAKSSDARLQTGSGNSGAKKEKGKKKPKGKKKELKIIDVKQSSIEKLPALEGSNNDTLFENTDISGPPTLCMESFSKYSKAFNTQPFRGKFLTLSPIPESPRNAQEKGSGQVSSLGDNNFNCNELPIPTSLNLAGLEQTGENGEKKYEENTDKTEINSGNELEESKQISPTTEDNLSVRNADGNEQLLTTNLNRTEIEQSGGNNGGRCVENEEETEIDSENDVKVSNQVYQTTTSNCSGRESVADSSDEVDGGIIRKLIGHCVPRLKMELSDSESDSESHEPMLGINSFTPAETNAQNENRVQNISEWDPVEIPNIKDKVRKLIPEDEADSDIEDLLSDILEQESNFDTPGMPQKRVPEVGRVLSPDLDVFDMNSFTEKQDYAKNMISQSANVVIDSDREGDREHSRGNTKAREIFSLSREDTFSSLSSTSVDEDRNHCSDTDSSYNSCDSTPRPFSDENTSSLDSDSYFSSPRDSSCSSTPTPYCSHCSSNSSVDIKMFERGLKRTESLQSSSSNSSSSTMKGRSNSPVSVGSEFSVKEGDNVVHSRLGSCSTASSEEEEIVWKKGNLLGKGAFGMVYCGLTHKGEMIAVKQVELNISDEKEAEKQYEKLQEEVGLLKSLKHENIVRYIGTCLDGGAVNIFMEYVPGGSIANLLARFGPLDESVFRRYTKQILCGVEYLHQNNVIHRDIKGGNIMLMPSGVIKLIDFGCAKRLCIHLSLSKSNILRSMKGTPYWMAPEVIKETGHGRKSDIWSVGCTVYEMATRKPPWSNMPPMTAIFAIGSGSPVPQLGEQFSSEARSFVKACLTRDPEFRPSAEELLQHEFIKDCC